MQNRLAMVGKVVEGQVVADTKLFQPQVELQLEDTVGAEGLRSSGYL